MFERKSRILIADNVPLSVLALLGSEALDWLFVPGADVWVTDMVREEALRDPDPGADQRNGHRDELRRWFEDNAERIHVQATQVGTEYRKAMKTWKLAGSPPDLKPSWANKGEASIIQALDGVEDVLAANEAVLVVVDDRRARAALRTLDQNLDLISTEVFVNWMAEGFRIPAAETAWQTVGLIMGTTIPKLRPTDDDPVSTFRR